MERILNKAGMAAIMTVLVLAFAAGRSARPALAIVPVNNDFGSAVSASPLPFSDTRNTTDATLEGGEPVPVCQGSFGHSVWYSFTVAAPDVYQIDTLSSDYDTVVAVYTGATLGTLLPIACDDDTPGIGTALQSQLTFAAAVGPTYRIQVSGWGSNSGNLHVHVALAGQTITVNSPADTNVRDAVLTLREAMMIANGTLAPALLTAGECAQIGGAFVPPCFPIGGVIGAPAADTIVFAPGVFPTGAPTTITLGSTLPVMSTGNDTVSGSGAGVIVDGVTTVFDCFAMTGANPNGNTVKGLQITRCNNGVYMEGANNAVGDAGTGAGIGERDVISRGVNGINMSGAASSGNFVRNNYIGTDVTGAVAGFGNTAGVLVNGAAGELIGGPNSFSRNVISENSVANIETLGAGSTGNVIQGNYIGTNAGGTAGLAGNGYGVYISGGSGDLVGGTMGLTPGGPCTGACNLISASSPNGLQLDGASGNTVQGNFIGTDVTGTAPIGNITGVSIFGGSANLIGGAGGGAGGNLISGNPFAGVELALGTTGNFVYGDNLIGTNAAGTGAIANGDGVNVESVAGNNILFNVISGNVNGVHIDGAPSTGNVVQGNYIGTNGTGTGPVANTNDGVLIDTGAPANLIGGTSGAATRNVISGNGGNGVEFNGGAAAGNTAQGNYIGTDPTGAAPIPNMSDGVFISNSGNNTVGGTAGITPGGPCTGACNVISGNAANGIRITGMSSQNNGVRGNYIGTNAAGTGALANGADGILMATDSNDNTIGSSAGPNTIAFNGLNGVCVTGATTLNGISANSIFSNTKLGIDLDDGGGCSAGMVTGNDFDDFDTGPNELLNFPSLLSAITSGASTTISGTLQSDSGFDFKIEFFSSPACDASGNGEGQTYLGSTPVTTDGGGNASFTTSGLPAVTIGHRVTATATFDFFGLYIHTSEFSACKTVTGPDSDGDGVNNVDEVACGSDQNDAGKRPERIDGVFAGVSDDGDVPIDEALPPGAANFDCDGDGYTGAAESGTPLCGNAKNDDDKTGAGLVPDDAVIDDGCPGGPAQVGAFSEAQFNIGGNDQDPCGLASWPSDFITGGVPLSTNKINVLDLTTFIAPPASRRLDTAPGQATFDSRWDLSPGRGVFNNMINVTDLTALIAGSSGNPPMLGGVRAFNGPTCPWPP